MWRSFFSLNEKWQDDKPDEKPSPPGYWGNEEGDRELQTYIQNDQYTLQWGDRSRFENPIDQRLEDKYDIIERLRFEVAGDPKWQGEQDQLELVYDDICDTFTVRQHVTVPDSRRDQPLASHEAA